MSKLKTHKGAKKRFRITKSGKAKRSKAGKSHLLSSKSGRRRRHLRKRSVCEPMDSKKILSLLGGAR